MDAEGAHLIFAEGAAGLALAASALAEAAQALSEAAAALSTIGQETKSPSTVYQSFETTPEVPESQEVDDEKDQIQEIDDDASSVGANTGNNVHRRDTTPEVGSNGATQSYNPAPPLGDPVPATSQPQVQHNSIDGQKQPSKNSLDGLLCPGRFYLVLDEEFDALPLILAYATAAKRTVCYVPTPGSLLPWESIISAVIPGRQVRSAVSFSGNRIMQLSDIVTHLASSDDGSVLVLRPTFIARANDLKAHRTSDSLIFWGLPGPKFWPSLVEAGQQSQHTLLILNQREYLDSNCQAFLTRPDFSFNAHPRHLEFNSFELGSMLADFRDSVERTISRAQHSQNIQTIYEELLESPINDTAQLCFVTSSPMERIDLVNKFIARVFLRGRIEDGTSRLTFNSQELQISERSYKRLGTIFGTNVQPRKATPIVISKPAANQDAIPPNTSSSNNYNKDGGSNPSTFTHRPGWWRITLQRDADAIPLICYLAQQHPKSLCCISHSTSAHAYGELFSRISTYEVTAIGKKQRSIEEVLETFSNIRVQSGLCLVRGNPTAVQDDLPSFKNFKAQALIYWGLPAHHSFLWPTKVSDDQFTYVYLIIPPDQSNTFNHQVLSGGDFPEHPDSTLLNSHGHGSPLHIFRDKVPSAAAGMSRNAIKAVSRFYKPALPPAYPIAEFLRKVMLRSNWYL